MPGKELIEFVKSTAEIQGAPGPEHCSSCPFKGKCEKCAFNNPIFRDWTFCTEDEENFIIVLLPILLRLQSNEGLKMMTVTQLNRVGSVVEERQGRVGWTLKISINGQFFCMRSYCGYDYSGVGYKCLYKQIGDIPLFMYVINYGNSFIVRPWATCTLADIKSDLNLASSENSVQNIIDALIDYVDKNNVYAKLFKKVYPSNILINFIDERVQISIDELATCRIYRHAKSYREDHEHLFLNPLPSDDVRLNLLSPEGISTVVKTYLASQ